MEPADVTTVQKTGENPSPNSIFDKNGEGKQHFPDVLQNLPDDLKLLHNRIEAEIHNQTYVNKLTGNDDFNAAQRGCCSIGIILVMLMCILGFFC